MDRTVVAIGIGISMGGITDADALVSNLELENGANILLEDGSYLLLES